jgi:hypothetical protein
MKKLFFLAIFFALCFRVAAQESELIIAFSPNDCINCSIGLTQLHTFPVTMKKRLVVRKNDKSFFEEFSRENLSLDKVQNLEVDYSDSLFALYVANNFSTCRFFRNGKEMLVFPLTELLNKRATINLMSHTFSMANSDTIHIDSLALSERISITRGGNQVFIYDYLLNKIAELDKPGMLAKNGSIVVMKPRVSKVRLMEAAHLDTTVYKKMLPLLKSIGKDKIRYEVLSWQNDTLRTLMDFSYPRFDKKDTIIGLYVFLGSYVNNKLVSLKYIDADALKSNYYNFDNTQPFFMRNNELYFSVYVKTPSQKDTKLFSEWHDDGKEQLIFDKYSDVALPGYYEKNKKEYPEFESTLRDSFYYSIHYPFIYNINSEAQYDPGCELERVEGVKLFGKGKEKTFTLQDVIAKGNVLELLYFIDTIPKIAYYDITEKRILYSTGLSLGKNLFMRSLVFLSPEALMVMDDQRKKIILFR